MRTSGVVLMKQDRVGKALICSYLSIRNALPTYMETAQGERYWVPELNDNVHIFKDAADAAETKTRWGGDVVRMEIALRLEMAAEKDWIKVQTRDQAWEGMGLGEAGDTGMSL